MRRGVGVRELLRPGPFRRLLATRLVAQTADGVFQTSLASAVLFNPDHQTRPLQVAAAFAVLLLPYSVVSPFAGVFLDRWRRREVLVRANLPRAALVLLAAALLAGRGATDIGVYAAALGVLSVSRFYLAALSAALPRVVRTDQLVRANALSTTAGAFLTTVGTGVGLGVRHAAGSGDRGSAVIAVVAAAVYLAAAAVAAQLPRGRLGPHAGAPAPLRHQLAVVGRGLVDGARHLGARPAAARALAVMATTRMLFGISTLATLLLYRNSFSDGGVLRAGLPGLTQALAAAAVGYVTAAAVTPAVTDRIGTRQWIVLALLLAAGTQLACGLPFTKAALLLGAAILGFATQASKICVDTILQQEVTDAFRGRVFSFYDATFNVAFVVAVVAAALLLPASGRSVVAVAVLSSGYAALAVAYGAAERQAPRRRGLSASPAPGST